MIAEARASMAMIYLGVARAHRAAMGPPRGDTVLDRGMRTIKRRFDKISASMVFRRFEVH